MTALKRRCIAAVKKFCASKKYVLEREPCHVIPRAYVVCRMAPGALAVAIPNVDAAPMVRAFEKEPRMWGGTTMHGDCFDTDLIAGDWCTVAYVCVKDRGQWHVAIKAVP